MDRDVELEMVACTGGCSQVPETETRVTGNSGDDTLGVRAPLRGVGAAVGWEGEHAALALWVPDLDCAVP